MYHGAHRVWVHYIGFSNDTNPGNSWNVQCTEIDGRRYVECTRANAAFEKIAGKQFHMLGYLILLRSQTADHLMQIKEAEGDPSLGDVELHPFRRLRQELTVEVRPCVVAKGSHSNGIDLREGAHDSEPEGEAIDSPRAEGDRATEDASRPGGSL